MNDVNDAPFVDKPKRNPEKWKKNKKGDGFSNKAKKAWKNRSRELNDEDDERELRDYRR
jgi:hypothetical protein